VKKIAISKSELIKEHKKIVPLLRKGTQVQRNKEAADQARELKRYQKGRA